MKHLIAVAVFALAVSSMGCAQVHVEEDDEVGQQDQALEAGSCEDRCMEEFHQCRESGGGGGPGASGCAHDKNECKDRC